MVSRAAERAAERAGMRAPRTAMAMPARAGAMSVVARQTSSIEGGRSRSAAWAMPGTTSRWIAIGYIAASRPQRVLLESAALAIATQIGCADYYARGFGTFTSTIAALVLGAVTAGVLGVSVRQRREHAAALRVQATAQAITAERLRIAREMHDVIAHSVGVIAIQAGMGSRVIDTQPAEARAALQNIEEVSRQTLGGLRRTLAALRHSDHHSDHHGGQEPEPTTSAGLADLDRLCATTAQAGVEVEVRRRGSQQPLPPEVDLSAFRIIQEAVPHVVRHAHTPACQVTIDVSDGAVALEIVDRGRGGRATEPGHGITGMRERADLLHGRLAAGPHPAGGFRVTARLPIPPAAR